MSLSHFQTAIAHRVDQHLQDKLKAYPGHAPRLKEAMQYALLMGGKRMRPVLAYATADMLDIPHHDVDAIATSIECIHAYSLIHDDLPAMDNDDLRRGHPTVHIAFDEATAILAGDALQSLAFEILSGANLSSGLADKHVKLLQLLSQASGYLGMCGGQAMDLAATNKQIDLDQLRHLHQLKTGALLKAAILMPATLELNHTDSDYATLELYATTLGLAFQVQDDILDIVSDSQTLGKPQGSDEAANKSTYPGMMGLNGAQDYLAELHQQALHALDALPYNTELLKSFTDYTVKRKF